MRSPSLRKVLVRACATVAVLATVQSAQADWLLETYSRPTVGTITNLATSDALIGGFRLMSGFPITGTVPTLNTQDNGDAGGPFGLGTQVPGLPLGDNDDFVIQSSGSLTVGIAGAYTFVNNTDDGSRLRLSINSGPLNVIINDDILSGPHDAPSAAIPLNAGDVLNYEWTWFERGGGAEGESYYRRDAGPNALIGDASQGLTPGGPLVVRTYKSDIIPGATINNFASGDAVRVEPGTLKGSAVRNVYNIQNDGGSSGDFLSDDTVPGVAVNSEDFIVVGTGLLVVPAGTGAITFRSNTDDGGRLLLDLNGNGVFDAGEAVINDDVLSGPHNFDSAPVTLVPGNYLIEYSFFERGGGAEGEVSASVAGGPFILLGNEAGGGLDVILVPEPAMTGLSVFAALGLLRRRR